MSAFPEFVGENILLGVILGPIFLTWKTSQIWPDLESKKSGGCEAAF